jgi:pyruvate carboxylase subunit B
MKENGWNRGKDDEELFEFAMHEKQYRDYKSGAAKDRFNKELEAAIKDKLKNNNLEVVDIRKLKYPNAEPIVSPYFGRLMWELDFHDVSREPIHGKQFKVDETICYIQTRFGVEELKSFCNGRIVGVEYKQGDVIYKGDILGYIQQ